jgi:hypothetical protein
MSTFDLFRKKQQNSEDCRNKFESSFILEGTSAVVIHSLRLNVNKQAALILTDKEGPDTSLVFTYKEQVKDNELLKGDYYTWKENTYLVYEDIDIVREVVYKKQKSYQCNISFEINGNTWYGYYVSSLAKYVDTTLQGNLNITDNDKPILILPQVDWMAVGVKLVISGKPYKIIDFDAITNSGIVYCSLDRDFVSKYDDIEEPIKPTGAVLTAGVESTLNTCFGYFQSDVDVDIVAKTYNSVKFIIPYGVETITITTKDELKNDIVAEYKVVI